MLGSSTRPALPAVKSPFLSEARSQYLPRLRSGAGAETVGDDPLPYGFESSRNTLETFIRFNVDQCVIPRAVAPEDLFVPETLTLG